MSRDFCQPFQPLKTNQTFREFGNNYNHVKAAVEQAVHNQSLIFKGEFIYSSQSSLHIPEQQQIFSEITCYPQTPNTKIFWNWHLTSAYLSISSIVSSE